jgi:hypothetical protein
VSFDNTVGFTARAEWVFQLRSGWMAIGPRFASNTLKAGDTSVDAQVFGLSLSFGGAVGKR